MEIIINLRIIRALLLGREASLVAQMVKRLPAMWRTWVQSLGREDPLEKEMATHSSILAWKFHRQRSLVGYTVHEVAKKSDTTLNYQKLNPAKWY